MFPLCGSVDSVPVKVVGAIRDGLGLLAVDPRCVSLGIEGNDASYRRSLS